MIKHHGLGSDMGTAQLQLGMIERSLHPHAQALCVQNYGPSRTLIAFYGAIDGIPYVGYVVVPGHYRAVGKRVHEWGSKVTVDAQVAPDKQFGTADGRVVIPLVGEIMKPSPDVQSAVSPGRWVAVRVG